jgi:hypothetical protein
MISSKRRAEQLPGASQQNMSSWERRKTLSRKALRGIQTPKVHSKARILIHLILNSLVVISWVILIKNVGLKRNIQGKGNIMPQLLRMMNPKEIRKVLLMRKKIEKSITWFLPYLVQFSRGRKTWLVDSGASKNMRYTSI